LKEAFSLMFLDVIFKFEAPKYKKKLHFRNASVIYIDNPVGAGFSYTMDEQGYPKFVNQVSML
jgi:hypothetical protein